jgi:two-component system chemotaxis response regulator CheB
MKVHDIIVIGSSTGGIEALPQVIGSLPKDLPASVFVVQHIAPSSKGYLAKILDRTSQLRVVEATDNEKIQRGHVYVAPPDLHLLIKDHHIRVVRGPKENRVRPAIDPLFRTAAVNHGSRVIGVVLTGALNDGTAGLIAIKQCGGLAVVQDPEGAVCQSMPRSAIENVKVDYVVPLEKMGGILTELVNMPPGDSKKVPENVRLESAITENGISDPETQEKIGSSSLFSCPECGGRFWEIRENKFLRFRCHLGHAYSATSALAKSSEVIESSLELTLRSLKERMHLLELMADDSYVLGQNGLAEIYKKQAREAKVQGEVINKMLMNSLHYLPE